MKIGILTFHEADSYGAVLQAYALQQTLMKLGAESEFVQIRKQKKQEQEMPLHGAAAIFARRIQAEGKKREALFAQFRKDSMKISEPFEPTDRIDDAYDCFVAGSDQIWNFRIPDADARYFLPFADAKKRYSYAASFGADELPEKARSWAAGQLSKFQGLSVREESGRRIIKELTGRDAAVCLDPTLLSERADWEGLAAGAGSGSAEPGRSAEPYVLLFLLKYDETLAAKAKEEAAKRGVALKVVTAAFMPQLGIGAWNGTGVTQWLAAIRDAQCVFTNSFHGVVFSLIFGKNFHVERLLGELSSRNGRIEELLAFLELSNAYTDLASPDEADVQMRLSERKKESLEYLRRMINYDIIV